MTQPKLTFPHAASNPWWTRNAFHFVAPHGRYDPMRWRQAVLQHAMIKDLTDFLDCRCSRRSPHYEQERIDEQGCWLPLQPTFWALDIQMPPEALFPLPQPRPKGSHGPNPWLVTLDEALLYESHTPFFVPLGLILTRLLPVSPRPIAQVVACWLLYQVLPPCSQRGGPDSWEGLDAMLSPVL